MAKPKLSDYMFNAIMDGNVNAVKRFIWLHKHNRAAMNARTENISRFGINVPGQTALTRAIISHQEQIVALLVASTVVDVNARNGCGESPMMIAAQCNNTRIMKILLGRSDANIEAEEPFNGDTALINAARFGNTEMVKLLLDHGANREHCNRKGITAAEAAQGHPDRQAALLTYQANTQANDSLKSQNMHRI